MTNNDEQMAALLSTNCRKHQDIAVYGEHGQRGCEDCVYTKQLITTTTAEAVREARIDELESLESSKHSDWTKEIIERRIAQLTNTKDAV